MWQMTQSFQQYSDSKITVKWFFLYFTLHHGEILFLKYGTIPHDVTGHLKLYCLHA